eukprot:2846585-Rhodomonas_salina.1
MARACVCVAGARHGVGQGRCHRRPRHCRNGRHLQPGQAALEGLGGRGSGFRVWGLGFGVWG